MGTIAAVRDTAITLPTQGDIVGPGSVFEVKRLALRKEFQPALDAAGRLAVIDTPEQAEEAVKIGRTLQAGTKEIEIFYKPIKVEIDALKKPILEAEKEDNARIDNEKKRIGSLVQVYDGKVRREREEADRKARAEAEEAAREAQLARALELAASGEDEEADALLEEPVAVMPVFTQTQAPASAPGKVTKVTYSMEVTDFMELVKAVAAGMAPVQALQANDSFLNGYARTMKDGFSITGCKLVKTEGTHFRS
jgi:hypothetical protein